MLKTIRHRDEDFAVVIARLMTGQLRITAKTSAAEVETPENMTFDAELVAHICTWQREHGITPDGVIGPDTWTQIAQTAPKCSTSKNRISGQTLALQLLLGGNLDADGIYGTRTKKAAAAWQAANGLAADGICGRATWISLIAPVGTAPADPAKKAAKFTQPADFKQGDSRWGRKMYSNHKDAGQTRANSGCGPTSMADIVATVKDKGATPYTLAQLSMKWGDRTRSSGTSWSFFKHVANYYKFSKMIQTASLATLKACLDQGGYAVCSMGPGYWTRGGHFICAWKYDSTYIYCNDPASKTRKRQKINDFTKQRKQFFCFWA